MVALAFYHASGHGLRLWTCSALAFAIAWAAARREVALPRRALWALAIVVASSGGAGAWLAIFGGIGAFSSALAAWSALGQVVATPGLGNRKARSPWWTAGLLLLGWGLSLVSSGAVMARPTSWIARMPGELATFASVLSLGALLMTVYVVARVRWLELDVVVRSTAAYAALTTAAVVAVGLTLAGIDGPARLGRVAVGVSSWAVVRVSLHANGVRVARVTRRLVVLGLVGSVLVLMGTLGTAGQPWEAVWATLVTGVLALALGAASPLLEAPLRQERGEWLDAFARARGALDRAEPDEAIRLVLETLQEPTGSSATELWTLAPLEVRTVDAAGYLHVRVAAEGPGVTFDVVRVASEQPEATLRSEVLDALVVRRPDVRPLARWMADRKAFAAVVVTRAGQAEGLLVLPRGRRTEPLALEEASALKELADHLAAVCHARGAYEAGLERERVLRGHLGKVEDQVERLQHELATHFGRSGNAAWWLAGSARVAYSASSHFALGALERRMAAGAPVALVAPVGVDPVAVLARAHMECARRNEPFVVVDGTASRQHDLARWQRQESSPLGFADQGTLVLLDGAALPLDVQRLIAGALAERRPPWEQPAPLDVLLVLTGSTVPEALVVQGRLDAGLAARLREAEPVVLPRLRERPEDLHALFTERLAREGLRARGRPVGIDPHAFARFVEYPFEGEEPELEMLVQRLVVCASSDTIGVADVEHVLARHGSPSDAG